MDGSEEKLLRLPDHHSVTYDLGPLPLPLLFIVPRDMAFRTVMKGGREGDSVRIRGCTRPKRRHVVIHGDPCAFSVVDYLHKVRLPKVTYLTLPYLLPFALKDSLYSHGKRFLPLQQ